MRQALELATIGGARVLGREAEIGSLEPGKLADVALWRLDTLPHAGIADPVAALVLGSPAPLELLLVNGRPVVEHDTVLTVDEHRGRAAGARGTPATALPDQSRAGLMTARIPGGAPQELRSPRRGTDTTDRTGGVGGVGASPPRPDGTLKVTGQFAYGSDLWMDDMIWGVTLRSPHPYARITVASTIGEALATRRRLRRAHPRGRARHQRAAAWSCADQPVLAEDVVRYQGEPVALVAADHPEIARRAAKKIVVDYEVLDAGHRRRAPRSARGRAAAAPGRATWSATSRSARATPAPAADVVVTGDYEVGMQDQAFLGPEAGLAVPDDDGGVDLYVATQWLHVDQRQICAALGLPPEQVRLTLAGVGGAFGGREDLSMHVHACLLALHTGKPVKMVYNREESFFGHVHRHPATMRYEHGATRDGTAGLRQGGDLPRRRGVRLQHPGRGRQRAARWASGRTWCRTCSVDAYGVYTNNPPCGAMRGFGSVQTAFAYEAQMDKLAGELGLDPVELRCRNAMSMGSEAPTGQIVDSPAPVAELLHRLQAMPLPGPPAELTRPGPAGLPGGVSNTTHGEGVVPRRRLRRGLQERRLLRGLRRLLDRPGPARGRPAASRWSPCTPPPPRSARAWSPSSSRSAAPSWAWTRWWSTRRTPPSAPAAPRRRRGRPT